MTTFDDILKTIGEFGPFQKRTYILLCFPGVTLSALLVIHVFILGVPEHRCKIPGLDNDTYKIQNTAHQNLVNTSIPLDEKGNYDTCEYYVTNNVTAKCSEWVYDDSVYTYTFAQKNVYVQIRLHRVQSLPVDVVFVTLKAWCITPVCGAKQRQDTTKLNMVCDNSIKIPNAQMIFYFGVLVGSYIYGQLSDIIGRRKALYLAILVLLGSSCGLVGMVEYVGFCVLLFLIGGASLGLYLCSYVISMEMVGPSKRIWTGNIIQLFLTSGVMLLTLLVYLIRDWRYFTLAVGLQSVFFLPYYWLIPESPRWLLSKDRKKEALVILERTAKSNKTNLNPKLLESLTKAPPQGRIWQLFTNKRLAFRTIIIFWNWFVCSMSYYGTVMNIGNLGGDFFFNFAMMTAVEYPAKIISMLLLDRWGRKRLHMVYLFVGGVACMGTMWPIIDGRESMQPMLITLALIGKLCMVGAFGTVYVLSSETFPTVVRNAGMGASSAIARVGSMIAPYIAKSATLVGGVTGQAIPLTLFGAAMFLAGVSTLVLPETLNRQLPETIEDAANVKRRKIAEEKEIYQISSFENGGMDTDIVKERL